MDKIKEDFFNGETIDAHKYFGAHLQGEGAVFRIYAPHAKKVEIKGIFTNWHGQELTKIDNRGIYEIYIEGVKEYDKYFYNILDANNHWVEKSDPYAFFCERRPSKDCKVFNVNNYGWNDGNWMSNRDKNFEKAVNIYELHLGSFVKFENEEFPDYERLAPIICEHVKKHGYNFVELMPILEHPLDKSWGYQVTNFFASTSRYGNPRQLMYLIDYLHQNNIGVILDFVCVHFASDAYGLINFDGKEVYEYSDRHKYSQWGSPNFNLGSEIVRSFLMSSVSYYLEKFHFDGVRIDAVNNIIYFDDNNKKVINKGGLDFIKRMNYKINERYPSVMLIAEDSSDFNKVCGRVEDGTLGFDYKWDLGWMNDTLKYFEMDPLFRKYHHHLITFSMHYYSSERFILPLSHDEVVHGKKSILNKMWGDYNSKFKQARLLYTYMFTHPGKKLNFMGNELGQFIEWDEKRSLDWFLLEYSKHSEFLDFQTDLNNTYMYHPALHKSDYLTDGFKWMMVDNKDQSIFTYYRKYEDEYLVVVLNMTPNYYEEYEVGVPRNGKWEEIINSDKREYGGDNNINKKALNTINDKMHGENYSIKIKLASFAGIVLRRV